MEDKYANGYVFMASSLDGFVARQDNSLDWLMKYGIDENDNSFEEFTKNIDVLVMGSGTFKTVLGFEQWPYKIPVYVLSRTLTQGNVPESLQEQVTIKALNPKDLMQLLYKKGLKKAYIDGGKLVQSFINDSFIKEITLTQIPILIGKGKRLFGTLDKDIDLELINSKPMKFGFIQNHYKVLNT
ncbi:dihydrofolate reductase [Tenacibaculum sp. S7007]|uniref:Dihydrofolate reductase n=1 Tax=Tenacibaculum pelagium TaxID=2759527 RepID=A0A839AJ07_9FLAO|nr:dihydrofolate reductase family protein [Tenacibaculum pelagium]MBA6155083.1 dihydrofolate reductase [Tenacibaculum pelagium]